ncbi:tryptophan-rich sensory protein, partial [Arthrobacter sp. GCM10027362]|uniref:tryptophan-rich sensory protein n=1 Tax=Arthrobacter sp. GCM10027362 TaxID=3273379 RepID=UPI00363E9044
AAGPPRERAAVSRAGGADTIRRLAVTGSMFVCGYTAVRGSGLTGGPSIRDAADGAFAPGFTLLALDSGAFLAWTAIYLGLLAYTVFQWFPSQRRSPRQRGTGWLAAASLLLNAGWSWAARAGAIDLTLLVILALLAVLAAAVHRLNLLPGRGRAEGLLVDAPMGLYLGWILPAAGANAASWLAVRQAGFWDATAWAVLAVAVTSFAGAAAAISGRGRL